MFVRVKADSFDGVYVMHVYVQIYVAFEQEFWSVDIQLHSLIIECIWCVH